MNGNTTSLRHLEALGNALSSLRPALAADADALETLRFADQLLAGLFSQQRNAAAYRSHAEALGKLLPDIPGDPAQDAVEFMVAAARHVNAHAADLLATPRLLNDILALENSFRDGIAERDAEVANKPRLLMEPLPPLAAADLTPHTARIWPGTSVREIIEIGGGFSKRTCRVLLDGPTPEDSEIILRQDLPVGPYGTTVVEEYAVLEALTRTDLPVAEPLYLHPTRSPLGRAFMFSRKLPGKTLGGHVTGFNHGAENPQAMLDVARLLARIHAVEVKAINVPGAHADLSPHQRIAEQIDVCRSIWERHTVHPSPADRPRLSLDRGEFRARHRRRGTCAWGHLSLQSAI